MDPQAHTHHFNWVVLTHQFGYWYQMLGFSEAKSESLKSNISRDVEYVPNQSNLIFFHLNAETHRDGQHLESENKPFVT